MKTQKPKSSKLSKAEAARMNGKKGGRPRKHMRKDPPESSAKPTGKWTLTRREEQFVHQVATFPEKSQGQCYIDAGYRAKNLVVASTNASRLIEKDRVARALATERQKLSERHQVTQERVIQELGRVAFLDVRRLFRKREDCPGQHLDVVKFYVAHRKTDVPFDRLSPEAQQAWTAAAEVAIQPTTGGFFLKSPDDLDDDTAAAIAGVEVVTRGIGDGEVEYVHKVRTVDKMGALTTLARHLGLLRDKDPADKYPPAPLFALPADSMPDVSGL